MKISKSSIFLFLFGIVITSVKVAHADNEPNIMNPVTCEDDNSNDDGTAEDYEWVYLGCFHDSSVNRKCPQTAKAKGYKWSMIKGECARSYWKCYGSM